MIFISMHESREMNNRTQEGPISSSKTTSRFLRMDFDALMLGIILSLVGGMLFADLLL